MKLIHFFGILAFLVYAVGSASAFAITTVNEPGDVPNNAIISIDVTYQNGLITFIDQSTGITGDWFKGFAYNLNTDPSSVDTYEGNTLLTGPWTAYWQPPQNQNQVTDGFGPFGRAYMLVDNSIRPTKVVVHLSGFTGTVPGNGYHGQTNQNDAPAGNQVAVHLSWTNPTTPTTSIKVTGGNGGSTSIPEFPSMALPVAGILGLMLILGRRNKE